MFEFKSNKANVLAEFEKAEKEYFSGDSFQAECAKCRREITVTKDFTECPHCGFKAPQPTEN